MERSYLRGRHTKNLITPKTSLGRPLSSFVKKLICEFHLLSQRLIPITHNLFNQNLSTYVLQTKN